ncbi:MAG: hypothetical protein Q7V31_10390 [Parvibaculum sp.]|uniref:hypothetical protein n=1 Tax=Parvibaculum sp. TaxID=2024848 RepID=UPI00271A2D18|nr:hypothetical protein [Parvibaculum sp.]MDO8839326.1 hypothetical protein [Parvibaculum sp.]
MRYRHRTGEREGARLRLERDQGTLHSDIREQHDTAALTAAHQRVESPEGQTVLVGTKAQINIAGVNRPDTPGQQLAGRIGDREAIDKNVAVSDVDICQHDAAQAEKSDPKGRPLYATLGKRARKGLFGEGGALDPQPAGPGSG